MVASNLAVELSQKGHEVHIISYKKPLFLDEKVQGNPNLFFHNVEMEKYPLFQEIGALYTIPLANTIRKAIKEHSLDLIHTHYGIPNAVSSYLATKGTKSKSVVTLHGSDVHTLGNKDSIKEIVGEALNNSNQVTTVSNYLSNLATETFSLEKTPLTVYNFIDTELFSPKDQPKQKVIVAASNYRPVKRIPFLVKIFGEVQENYPNWKLKLIGDGPERPICHRIAKEGGFLDKIMFQPPTKDIPIEFSTSSILAAPSQIESFGLTIAEGLSSGTPVWATNVGGIPEVCVHGSAGYLFEVNSVESAINSLEKLMGDESLRNRFGEFGRKFVIEKFNKEKIIAEYESIYETLLQ